MGKTVKSRLLISITSFVCVVALCLIANSGIPSLYKSQKEKAAIQAAATKISQQVSKPSQNSNSGSNTPATTPDDVTVTDPAQDPAGEQSNDFDIPDEVPAEEPEQVEDETPVEDEPQEETPSAPEKESFFDKIISFFTSIFETLFSGDLFAKIKEFFGTILSFVGIQI